MINKTYQIGWFSTGKDEAAGQLLKVIYDNIKKKKLRNIAISFVFSDRIKGEKKESDRFFRPEMRKKGFESAKKGNYTLINYWRNSYHLEVTKLIDAFRIDLIVLAGYMLVVGKDLCYNYPMINLHPALPGGPRGTWQEVIWELIKQKAKESGIMMHLVTPQLDAGPTLTCCGFPLAGDKFDSLWKKMEDKLKKKSLERIKEEEGEEEPLFKQIREEGVKRELPLIVYTLKAISEKRIEIEGEKVILDREKRNGYCLNEEMKKETKK